MNIEEMPTLAAWLARVANEVDLKFSLSELLKEILTDICQWFKSKFRMNLTLRPAPLASHNSCSFATPFSSWARVFGFVHRCQSVDLHTQYDLGARLFDIRVHFIGTVPYAAHGSAVYNYKVHDALYTLETIADYYNHTIPVRILLESKKDSDIETQLFCGLCKSIKDKYPHLRFFSARSKQDWKVLHKFEYPDFQEPSLDDKYSSMTLSIIDDWCPWFYARFMNKRNISKGTDKDYLFIDFINIQ